MYARIVTTARIIEVYSPIALDNVRASLSAFDIAFTVEMI